MRYAEIKHNDIANGSGVCVSYWTQGCSHRCKGCHNPQTWNPNAGKEGTLVGVIDEILKAISANGITRNFSILGGEPLDSYNVGNVQSIIDEVRNAYPDVKIYLWTGYTLENLTEAQLNAIKNIDILIDGKFEEDLKDLTLELRGSSNQRILTKEDIYGEIEKRKKFIRTTAATGFATRIKK